MNKRAVASVLGVIFMVFSAFILFTSIWFMLAGDRPRETMALLETAILGTVIGAGLYLAFSRFATEDAIGTREGMAVTAIAWVLLAGLGGLPFHLAYPLELSFTDGYFECMSGLTTTGASILPDIEKLGQPLLFWRSLTHWLGGMGIILLVVAILPLLGTGGYQLFRAEVPGPTKDRLKPRIVETAKTLWKIYVGLTLAQIVLLKVCGLSFFDALCHSFASMATGGYSNYNASVAWFSGPQSGMSPLGAFMAEMIIVVFMFLAGTNFVLLFNAWTERSLRVLWRSSEFRVYLGFVIGATAIIALLLVCASPIDKAVVIGGDKAKQYTPLSAVRSALFQVVSIMTTTGFATDDFDLWPTATRILLLILMLVGGCAGSTSGGMKVARIVILLTFAWRELIKTINPRQVVVTKFEGRPVEREVVGSLLGFSIFYLGALIIGTFSLALVCDGQAALRSGPPPAATSAATLVTTARDTGEDPLNGSLVTAFSACLGTLGNVGPGLAGVGPIRNYYTVPTAGKWILCLLMLMGRLEIFPVLALFSLRTWRK